MANLSEVTALRKMLKNAGYQVIPITGKRPAFAGWQKTGSASDAEIERWVKDHSGARSTGILTEYMPVIDIDLLDDAAATAIEDYARKTFGDRGRFLTRFGNEPKRAIPFRTDKPFSKINVALIAPDGSTGQKLELLGKGQQLVAFGKHADTKKPYRWVGGEPGDVARSELPPLTEAAAAKFMMGCTDILVKHHGYTKSKERPEKSDTKKNSDQSADDWRVLTQNILEGTDLHESLRDLSMKLVRSGMSAGAAVNFLYGAMDACTAPHDHRWLARRGDIKRLVADAEGKALTTDNSQDDGNESPLEYFPAAIAEEKSKTWLIKNVVATAETSSWIGPPKSGKSALLVDLCLCITRGVDWRGFKIKKKAGVVYLALERGDLVKRRLKGHAKRDRITDTPFAIRRGIVNLMTEDSVDAIINLINEAAKEFGCDVGVLVIDTYSKAVAAGGGEENSAKDQNIVASNLRQIQQATGVHIALVGHTGKDESRGARGSNAHLGDVDAMMQFSHDGDAGAVAVEVTGANDQPEGPLTRFTLQAVEIGRDEDGEVISTHVVDEEEHGKHAVVKEKRLSPQLTRALDILHATMKSQGVKAKVGDYFHHFLEVDQWRDACKRASLSIGDEKSVERVFRKCVTELREAGKLELIDGRVRLLSIANHPNETKKPITTAAPANDQKARNPYQLFHAETQQSKRERKQPYN